jgi:hypothetical protein
MSFLGRIIGSSFIRGIALGTLATAFVLITFAFMFRSVLPMLLGSSST